MHLCQLPTYPCPRSLMRAMLKNTLLILWVELQNSRTLKPSHQSELQRAAGHPTPWVTMSTWSKWLLGVMVQPHRQVIRAAIITGQRHSRQPFHLRPGNDLCTSGIWEPPIPEQAAKGRMGEVQVCGGQEHIMLCTTTAVWNISNLNPNNKCQMREGFRLRQKKKKRKRKNSLNQNSIAWSRILAYPSIRDALTGWFPAKRHTLCENLGDRLVRQQPKSKQAKQHSAGSADAFSYFRKSRGKDQINSSIYWCII